jgi:hypothetical protein
VLPGTAVASAADGLKNRMPVEGRGVEWLACAPMQANRDKRGVENWLRVLITG